MEVKVSRSRVLKFLKRTEYGEGDRKTRITIKVVVWGKWMSNSKIQAGVSTSDSRSFCLGSNDRQLAWLWSHIGSQS